MKKKAMILAVCLVLVGLLAVNGTLAQTVEDIFVTITTKLGINAPQRDEAQLDVALVAYHRQGDALVQGSGSQALMPMSCNWDEKVATSVGGTTYDLWPTGALDKFSAVKNSSPTKDAVFRMAFAVDAYIYGKLQLNFTKNKAYQWSKWKEISIDGRDFMMIVATYTGVLRPGEVSPPVLLQVGMDKSATNEHYARLSSDFLQIQALAVDADALVTDSETPRPSAVETLNTTMPLNEGFNPFD